MSNDLNKWMGIIRLTRDPELKYTPSGKSVCNFSGASSQNYKSGEGEKKETVSFFDFQVWGKLGEVINEYAKKGMRLAIDGKLQQQRWDDQDGKKRAKIEIVVENFQFLDGKKESSESKRPEPDEHDNPFSDSDVPY